MSKKKGWELDASDAVCPFFRDHTSMTIGCESPIPGSAIRMTFEKKEDKTIQYKAFCCRRYQCCEIFRMVMEKYIYIDEEEGHG